MGLWKRTAVAAAVVCLGVTGIAGAAAVNGTPGDELLLGTNSKDAINGFGGTDLLFGKLQSDGLNGGDSAGFFDFLYGGAGEDAVNGGVDGDFLFDDDASQDGLNGDSGDDVIYAADGVSGMVNCGPGAFDMAFADREDLVSGCERVVCTSGTAEAVLAGAFIGGTVRSAVVVFGTANLTFATNGADVVAVPSGSPAAVFAKRGNDTITGGTDNGVTAIFPGDGNDTVNGGDTTDLIHDDDDDHDTLNGGDDFDIISAANGVADTIDCGPGNDVATVDAGLDSVVNCENVAPS
jgi:Ca2+-binding RTX toxin-like protein